MKLLKKSAFTTAIAVGLFALAQCQSQAQNPQVRLKYFVVTAASSPNNDSSIQNVVTFMEKGGQDQDIGLIPTNIATDPAALNYPDILRASEIISTSTNLNVWDAVSNTNAAFAAENGQRLAWAGDWRDTNLFLVSDISFMLSSSDGADSLLYSGNLATNTMLGNPPLTFSPTLWGEVIDANGNITASYHNGETIPDHPVNRVLFLLREGYVCNTMADVTNDLDYFRDVMPLVNTIVVTSASSGFSATNRISSDPFLNIDRAAGVVTLEGQRRIGLSYSIQESPTLGGNPPSVTPWVTATNVLVDGSTYTGTLQPNDFFRAFQASSVSSNFVAQGVARTSAKKPVFSVWNGPE